jgi:hypothetical protein
MKLSGPSFLSMDGILKYLSDFMKKLLRSRNAEEREGGTNAG